MSNLITEVDILDESKDCFLQYTEEVLTDRAVPSAEDGLLSVHRKLIWTMEEILKMDSKSKFKKSASIVGSTLASSYYHGDSACYGALCKIAQPYLMRYPLVEGDGNLGTQEGNGLEASSRYTNARPSKYADLMMIDFKKNIVPLKETYNGEYLEPVVLPSLLPNAIVNGRETIAIGLAHCSMPHNLSEVCDAIVAHIKKGSKLTVDELMEYIKGPDFPLENTVINSKDIKTAFATGHSSTSLKVRGEYEIKKDEIIFNTIPYRTYRNKIKEQINKNIDIFEEFLSDFSDESNVGKNKLVFKVKKNINIDDALEKIFELTDLQTTLSYNMNYIVDGTPKMCSMMDLVESYVKYQTKILINATIYDKDKAIKRKNILEGLLLIITNIDKAIKLIRESKDKNEAEHKLIKEFNLNQEQVKAVLDMKLSRLTKLDKDDLVRELEEKKVIIAECDKILNDNSYRDNKIIEKIIWLKNKYGDKRKTKLLNIEIKPKEKKTNEISSEDVVVTVSKNNFIKRVPNKSFKQNPPKKKIKSKDDILDIIYTNTAEALIVFSSKGKMYKIQVKDIPEVANTSKGFHINNFIHLENDEEVLAIIAESNKEYPYVFFITKNGMLKKTALEEFAKLKKGTGTSAIKIKEGDSLIDVFFADKENFVLATKDGMAIQFLTDEINPIGRVAIGIKAVKLAEGDEVISCNPIRDKSSSLLIVSKNGYSKRISLEELPIQLRAGKGVIIYKVTNASGEVAAATVVNNKDIIYVNGRSNSVCISSIDVPILSRISVGNIIIKNSIVNSIVKL